MNEEAFKDITFGVSKPRVSSPVHQPLFDSGAHLVYKLKSCDSFTSPRGKARPEERRGGQGNGVSVACLVSVGKQAGMETLFLSLLLKKLKKWDRKGKHSWLENRPPRMSG